jgi:RNA-directed DNA polymerase
VKDRVLKDIGATTSVVDWATINWKSVRKRVRNLRQRIYRATQNQQWNRVRSLMKLMLRSFSNLLLAIRRVTQENQGKQTPGIDGQKALTPTEREKLVLVMQQYTPWQVRPTKRVYIPKANGKRRPLGIPCIVDRVAQTIVKNALEPSWEARFEANSYGFRCGRNVQDAIEQCWSRLKADRHDCWVLDADILSAFDTISHDYLLKTIGDVPGKALIKQWLKAGYVESEVLYATENGTPQGSVISPLLANIALDGMDDLTSQYQNVMYYTVGSGKNIGKQMPYKRKRYGFIRFADDFVVTASKREELEAIMPTITEWLAQRGLQLHPEKTKIVHINDGFDFLGFTIRRFKGRCLIKPQKRKTLEFVQKIRDWLKQHPGISQEELIRQLNPQIRGWGNFYRHQVSKEVFGYVDHQIWQAIWKWCLKRHPNKSKAWVANKYFSTIGSRSWVFTTTVASRTGRPKVLSLYKLADIPIQRHVKVKGKISPDDPQASEYWRKRQTCYGKSYWTKDSKLYRIAQNQDWECPVCGEHLFNGEELHQHHVKPIKDGGTDWEENIVFLHSCCHYQMHMHKKSG